MWGKNKKPKSTAQIDSLVGQNTEIKGDVVFSGGLQVPNVVVNGTVNGDVYASGHVELAPEARIHGNVYYALIEMAMGSEVNGNLVHKADESVVPLNREEASSSDT